MNWWRKQQAAANQKQSRPEESRKETGWTTSASPSVVLRTKQAAGAHQGENLRPARVRQYLACEEWGLLQGL